MTSALRDLTKKFEIWPIGQFEKDYEVGKEAIGHGQYGEVFLAQKRSNLSISASASTVAVKFLKVALSQKVFPSS